MNTFSLLLFCVLILGASYEVISTDSSININFASILAGAAGNPSTGTCPTLAPTPAPATCEVPLPKWLRFLVPLLNISGNCFGQSQTECNSSPNCYFYFGYCLEAGVVPYPQVPVTPTSTGLPSGPTTTAAPTPAPALRAETTVPPVIALNASRGKEVGAVYQAFLSPQQEGGEEEDTPASTPSQFKSTKPSTPRNQRTSKGHGVVQFTRDLSKAYAYLAIENIDINEINLLHIHCGRPGQLGPILVDFGKIGNYTQALKDGMLAFEVTNEDIVAVSDSGKGTLLGLATAGCPIIQTIPVDKVKTIAGMELIARSGELYWNLHTYAQTYYGDVRGQLVQVTSGN